MIKNALRELLNELDKIAVDYGGIRDTYCREILVNTIFDIFVELRGNVEIDEYFGVGTDEGDKLVYSALAKFFSHPELELACIQLKTAQERLDVFQDSDVVSDNGNHFDAYFGYCEIP